MQLFPCEICSSGTTHDSQLGRIQPLVNTVFESYKNNRDDSEASEIVVVKTESSPPPSLPPAPIVNESAIHDRFKVNIESVILRMFLNCDVFSGSCCHMSKFVKRLFSFHSSQMKFNLTY